MRNWCGARLVIGLSELRSYRSNVMVSGDRRGCPLRRLRQAAASKSTRVASQPTMTVPRYFHSRPLLAQSEQVDKCAGRALQIGQPALSGKADKLGIRSHAGLGLYEIVIILDGLHTEIEI